MPAAIDITGKTFNRLTAIKRVQNMGNNTAYLFRCACSNEIVTRGCVVIRGLTKSCGCLVKEINGGRMRDKHEARKSAPGYAESRIVAKARKAYFAQNRLANKRGIPFLLTFDEWWTWWKTDNRWESRGRRKDQLVMARLGDVGPYSLENIYCATQSQNLKDVASEVRVRAGTVNLVKAQAVLRQRRLERKESLMKEWERPTMREISLGAEINAYQTAEVA